MLIPLLVNNIHIRTNSTVREVFLDSGRLSSNVIDDEEGVDTVISGGNESDADFEDDLGNDNDADDDEDDQKDDDDDCESIDAATTDVVVAVIDKMLLDSRLRSSDAIGDDEGVDTVGDRGNGDVTVFKDSLDNDNANEDDEKDVFVALIDGDGGEGDDSGADCSSGVQCM